VEPYRERIEDFTRRYGYEGNRTFRVSLPSSSTCAPPTRCSAYTTEQKP
jgi:hypothetical protein